MAFSVTTRACGRGLIVGVGILLGTALAVVVEIGKAVGINVVEGTIVGIEVLVGITRETCVEVGVKVAEFTQAVRIISTISKVLMIFFMDWAFVGPTRQ